MVEKSVKEGNKDSVVIYRVFISLDVVFYFYADSAFRQQPVTVGFQEKRRPDGHDRRHWQSDPGGAGHHLPRPGRRRISRDTG